MRVSSSDDPAKVLDQSSPDENIAPVTALFGQPERKSGPGVA
jgi:hypothetical protein